VAGRRRLPEIFSYCFADGGDLRDHSVGNLIIAALTDMAGRFTDGVEQAEELASPEPSVQPSAGSDEHRHSRSQRVGCPEVEAAQSPGACPFA